MIQSFSGKTAEQIWKRELAKGFDARLARIAKRKLNYLDAATSLDDLRAPPGNRLEKLRGNRGGQHSIRVNDQYRICFTWHEGGPSNVEITDYH